MANSTSKRSRILALADEIGEEPVMSSKDLRRLVESKGIKVAYVRWHPDSVRAWWKDVVRREKERSE